MIADAPTMDRIENAPATILKAVHGLRPLIEDSRGEIEFAASLRERFDAAALGEMFARFGGASLRLPYPFDSREGRCSIRWQPEP